MDTNLKQAMAEAVQHFDLPTYNQLPDMGLYLEQCAKYINMRLKPLGFSDVTSSMIRNYVKMGLVQNPVQKQYYADHIAHLIVISILKQVLPLEHINALLLRQKQTYTNEIAYNYFCMELKNTLFYRFGLNDAIKDIGETSSFEKEMVRSAVTAVSNISFYNACIALHPPIVDPKPAGK